MEGVRKEDRGGGMNEGGMEGEKWKKREKERIEKGKGE